MLVKGPAQRVRVGGDKRGGKRERVVAVNEEPAVSFARVYITAEPQSMMGSMPSHHERQLL